MAELSQDGSVLAINVATFVPNKHLALGKPALNATATVEDGQVAVTLQSDTLARFVEVAFDGADAIFSDNYFDLPAGGAAAPSLPLSCRLDGRGRATRGSGCARCTMRLQSNLFMYLF